MFRRWVFFTGIPLLALGIGFAHRTYVPPILMYHHIDHQSPTRKTSVSPESFNRQMEFLKAHQYRVLSLSEYLSILKAKKGLPQKSVLLTFDDGYDDNFTHAYPVLKRMGFPATIFVEAGRIGKPGYLGEEDLRILSENGIEIGNHTFRHARLTELGPQEVREEIQRAKERLEEILGKRVRHFSYPGGSYNDTVQSIVEETGHESAVTTSRPEGGMIDPFALRRVRISRTSDSLLVFWLKISGFYSWIEEVRG